MMNDIQYYASLILKSKQVILKKTPKLIKCIEDIAKDIASSPRANGRSFDSIYKDTKKIAIEFALEDRTGFIRNPKSFDKTDKHSYAYDNIDTQRAKTFECISQYQPNDLTYYEDSVRTKFKNADIIDYIVSAKITETSDQFEVFFTRIIDAKTFKLCTKIRNGGILEYNDVAAIKRGYAIKYEEEYV